MICPRPGGCTAEIQVWAGPVPPEASLPGVWTRPLPVSSHARPSVCVHVLIPFSYKDTVLWDQGPPGDLTAPSRPPVKPHLHIRHVPSSWGWSFRVRVSWDAEQPVEVDTLHDTGPPRRTFQKAAARVQAAGSAQRRLSTSIRLGREDRAGVRRTPGSRRRHILTLGRVQTHGGSPSPADRAAGLAPRPAGKLCMGTESCRQQDFGEDRCP